MHAGNDIRPATEVDGPVAQDELVLPLLVEEVSVERRRTEKAVVRVTTVTRSRDHLVDETLTHERVEVERVPIGRQVDAPPPVREEGDTTVMSVVEEIVVIERRWFLKEEVRIRRVRETERHVETVSVRDQEAVITRVGAEPPAA